jgi:hypothetical protein
MSSEPTYRVKANPKYRAQQRKLKELREREIRLEDRDIQNIVKYREFDYGESAVSTGFGKSRP